jgi:hypothetical protein
MEDSKMDAIGPANLEELLAPHASPCVSIYTPTHATGAEGQNDPLRFDELIDDAEKQLQLRMRRSVDARELLAPCRELVADEAF